MVDWLPTEARRYVLYVPMVHCVELVREGYFGSAVRAYHEVAYVVQACLLISALALAQERRATRTLVLE